MTCSKVAVTVRFAAMLTVHWLPFTESQPVQLLKNEPALGVAVRVTEVPLTN